MPKKDIAVTHLNNNVDHHTEKGQDRRESSANERQREKQSILKTAFALRILLPAT